MRGLGLIGYGWAARTLHLGSYAPLFRLRAVCGRTKEKVERIQKEFGFERAYTDWKDIIRDPQVEVVVLCTPASTRAEIILAAAEARKHVFTEKPLAWSMEEASLIVEGCGKSGVKLAVADQYRFFPHVVEAGRIIAKGMIGTPFAGLLENKLYLDFPSYPGQKRGFVVEQVTHNVDQLRGMLGEEVAEVYARMGRSPAKTRREEMREFWSAITLTFAGGAVVQLFNSWDCLGYDAMRGQVEQGPEGKVHIEGEKGTLFVNKDRETPLALYSTELGAWLSPDLDTRVKVEELERYGTGESMKAFLSWLDGGPPHPVRGDEYMKTLAVAFAAYESAEKNRPVAL